MKAILQLLKEFWVPLAVAVAWTAFNIFQMPNQGWTITRGVNLFAPTFFFVSWLVAQWYRVRKQQRVEESLAEIGARIERSAFPILPLRLVIVSHHTSTPEALSAFFEGRPEYRELSDNVPLMSAPMFRDIAIWNWGRKIAKRRYCAITRDALPDLVRVTAETGETPVKLPVRLSVEFSFPKTKSGPLVLRARDTWSDDVVSDLELMDDEIYQQFAFKEWEIENASRKAWNLADLRGAKIKVVLKYLFFDPINLETPPRVNDLHLCFGRGTVSTLYLQESQLAAQRWADDDEDRRNNDANEHAWMKTLVLEFDVGERLYDEQIIQTMSPE